MRLLGRSLTEVQAMETDADRADRELLLHAARRALGGDGPGNPVLRRSVPSDREGAADVLPSAARTVAFARQQGMVALVHRALDAVEPRSDDVLCLAFAQATTLLAARALSQLATLSRVVGVLQSAGVAVLVYKGPLLSLRLYGDAGLRDSADIDLLVARRDYARARRALIEAGFPPRGGHTLRQEQALFGWLGHAVFGGGDHLLELHWRLAPRHVRYRLSAEEAIERSTLLSTGGTTYRILEPADLAITLATHGARHLYERLEWLVGFRRSIDLCGSSLSALVDRAAELGAQRMLLVSVAVAERVLGPTLTTEERTVLQAAQARDPSIAGLADRIVHTMPITPGSVAAPAGFALQRLYAALADSPLAGARSLLLSALLPTEREWEAIALPDRWVAAYPLVRPIRLAARLLARLARPLRAAA